VKEKITLFLNILNKRFTAPFEKRIGFAFEAFTRSQRIAFYLLLFIFIVSTVVLVWKVNNAFTVTVPAKGGSLVEGVVGYPSRINPLFDTSEIASDADRDLAALIYSGLLKATPEGNLITDLAENYEISKDGLTYTFTLKNNIFWHDGEPVTADDVVFTIEKAKETGVRSPKRANWDGVSVEKINDRQIRFILQRQYSPFLENATMGIIPKHIWENIDPVQFEQVRFNREPIGSGPYKLKKIKLDNNDIPKYYDLIPFKKYTLGSPYIENLRIRFYANIDDMLKAFDNKEIEGINSIPPQTAELLKKKGYRVERTPLPRVFGVFFNQNQANIFTDKKVRHALNVAVDKEKIVNDILRGYGKVIDSPIPPGALGYTEAKKDEFTSPQERIKYAKSILENDGWKFNKEKGVFIKKTKKKTEELSFSISTSGVTELKEVVNSLKKQWEDLGARVEVKIYERSLDQDVIRPRKYDALFFGEIIGRDSDPFAFWHSSQRLDPGYNIALYANIDADKLLEDTRKITNTKERIKKYRKFNDEVKNDIPAIFVYSPDFIYIIPKKIKGVNLGSATTPSERFLNIYKWHIETDRVWKIFAKNLL
jgi:peptide/nickel transport system substrate-binding protein